MTEKIVGEKYIILDDTSEHGFIYHSEVTLIHDDGSRMPLFENRYGEKKFIKMGDVSLVSEFRPLNVQVLAGDVFKVVGNEDFHHSFTRDEIVTATSQKVTIQCETYYQYENESGKKQFVLFSDLERLETFGEEELDEVIASTVRTEHVPRDNTNFTLTINEQALYDDIPFIIDAYYTANLSLREVGSLLGVDEATIRRRMKKHGVPTRTVSQALRAKYSL
jgi:hypothetical protein